MGSKFSQHKIKPQKITKEFCQSGKFSPNLVTLSPPSSVNHVQSCCQISFKEFEAPPRPRWSAYSPSTQTIKVRILLKPIIFFCEMFEKNINKHKEVGFGPLKNILKQNSSILEFRKFEPTGQQLPLLQRSKKFSILTQNVSFADGRSAAIKNV